MDFWLICSGLGMLWHGALVLWVGGMPHAFRRGEKPTAPAGSAQAFMIFWLDQYSYIGLVLAVAGLALTLTGWLL